VKSVKTLLLILAIGASLQSNAIGNEGANGGDEVGLEFQQAFAGAVAVAKVKSPAIYGAILKSGLETKLANAKIVVVDEALPILVGEAYQDSIATNDPQTMIIKINRTGWNQIPKAEIKQALALHEVASLAFLESTGVYPLSGEYLGLFGMIADAGSGLPQVCGKAAELRFRAAQAGFGVGEVDRLTVNRAAISLQQEWLKCGRVSKKAFCAKVLPLMAKDLEGINELRRIGQANQLDYANEMDAYENSQRFCASK
jgi:hypothetical protein